ncbi:UDP-N-acetyl-D-mannosamine dehydrogenase [Rosistilla oblonga]|uniref:UDP-N-acetyl-D-mannosamine dehydrogenase n=1 Tax=Rosistilla oblonga TaxID=2527990 RepID=UPI003A96D85E
MSRFATPRLSENSLRLRVQRSKVCVIGMGYIGLPTASVLADSGYDVCGVDVGSEIVETINRGEIHIHEPHLGGLVADVVQKGRLRASMSPEEADVFMICVPTPVTGDHAPDLTYVKQAAAAIRPFVRKGNIVILESTSPPRTTQDVVVTHAIPDGLVVGEDVFIAYCPERVLPGRILIEVIENDRIVGGVTKACADETSAFYRTFVKGQVHATTAINAELTKLTENAYRDVNIAFANELSMMAAEMEGDALEVIRLANHHPRVNILNPGPGVGGHCISVDPWFLVHAAPEQTQLIRTAREVNDKKPHFVVQQIEALVREHNISAVGCLGLAYKADVDDLRESPSLEIVRELNKRQDLEVLACDPFVSPDKFSEFTLYGLDHVLQRSQLLVLLTDHSPFVEIEHNVLAGKLFLDTRNQWGAKLHSGAVQPDSALEGAPVRRVA